MDVYCGKMHDLRRLRIRLWLDHGLCCVQCETRIMTANLLVTWFVRPGSDFGDSFREAVVVDGAELILVLPK